MQLEKAASASRSATMNKLIPAPVLSLVADFVADQETHASLDSLFTYAEATGDPPPGSKPVKALTWLRATNKAHPEPLAVLGRIIHQYMEAPEVAQDYKFEDWGDEPESSVKKRETVRKIEAALAKSGLQYRTGGHVTDGGMAPSKTLRELIHGRDLPAIHREFDRAMESVEAKPRDAVSAAANVLESVFKVYIEDNGLTMPDKQDLQPVFKVVRAHLGLDPASIEDQDLQRIITGLFSVVDGIGALRTHASSAHSEGRKGYKLEPRHARLGACPNFRV
jgi:Abortive infection C-terminus